MAGKARTERISTKSSTIFFNLCKRFISRSTQLRVLGIKVSLLEDGLDHFQR